MGSGLAGQVFLRYHLRAEKLKKKFISLASEIAPYDPKVFHSKHTVYFLRMERMAQKRDLSFSETVIALLTKLDAWVPKSRRGGFMPFPLSLVTGPMANKLLDEYCAEAYPNGEQHAVRREALLQKLAGRIGVQRRLPAEDPQTLTALYTASIKQRRELYAKLRKETASWRPFRGNPFR